MMLEGIRKNIEKLVSLYESEREARIRFQTELESTKAANEAYRKQIIELERQIDTLRLTEAFTAGAGDNPAAKEKIDKLIREIDKCISLLEK